MAGKILGSLDEMFCEGVCYELVLTTIGHSGTRNAAPVGVRRSGNTLVIDLEEETLSLSNLRSTAKGVLNVVHDPLIFALAAFNTLPESALSPLQGTGIPMVRDADAAIEVRSISESPFLRTDQLGTSQFFRVILEPIGLEVRKKPKPVSRRTCAAIEAIIAVTKAEVAGERGLCHLFPEFQQTALRAESVARRTGDDVPTEKALDMCRERLRALTERMGGTYG